MSYWSILVSLWKILSTGYKILGFFLAFDKFFFRVRAILAHS